MSKNKKQTLKKNSDKFEIVVSYAATLANKTGSWRTLKPIIDEKKCISCMICWKFCPDIAIRLDDKPKINYDYCKGCGICVEECPVKAIFWQEEER